MVDHKNVEPLTSTISKGQKFDLQKAFDEDDVIVKLSAREAAVLVTLLDVFLPGSNHEIIMKIMNDTDDNANNDNNLV